MRNRARCVHVLPQQLAAADILLRRGPCWFARQFSKESFQANEHVAAQLSSAGLPGIAVGAILRSKAGLSDIRLRKRDLSRGQRELTND